MYKKIKSILTIILSMLLIVPYFSVSGKALLTQDTTIISDKTIDETIEEKVICTATLDDEFDDGSIIVSLRKNANPDFRPLSQVDFPEIRIEKIESLTESIEPIVKKVREIKNTQKASSVMTALNKLTSVSTSNETSTSENKLFEKFSSEELLQIEDDFNQVIRIDLENKGKQNVLDAIKELEKREDVLVAEPNYIYSLCYVPNDTFMAYQWAIDAMDLENAWDITTGSSEVLVGIVDSGIDSSHPDLIANLNTALAKDFTDENDVTEDLNGHGTHVAGIVGAVGNNLNTIAGVCWNVKLVNLRVFSDEYDSEGRLITSIDTVINAIKYATANKIPILNLSLSGSGNSAEFKKAINDYKGLAVCAAGNDSVSIDENNTNGVPQYPASYDCNNIISVAASDQNDLLAQFSNYGENSVDLIAPGVYILSSTPNDTCTFMEGTSMAAPQVAGVAALLKSKYPNITVEQIKDAILDNVDLVPGLFDKCVTGGRLNAYKALRYKDKYFTVRYNSNGGSGSMPDTKVIYGVSTKILPNTFTRSGYDFDCWYIKRSSDGKWRYQNADNTESGWYTEGQQPEGWSKYRYDDGISVSKTVSNTGEVVTFYAQWKKYFTVQYNANGGSGTMANTKVYYGVSTKLRTNTFTRSGYDFDCWFIKRSSDGKWRYQNADNTESGWYTEGQQPEGWSKYRYDDGIHVSKTVSNAGEVVTLYAQWKKYFTVKYNANGGSGSMADTKVYYGVSTKLRTNTFTRSGYDFDCWFIKRSSDGKWRYQNADNTESGWYTEGQQPEGWSKYRYDDGIHVSKTVSNAGEVVTLYAQWKKYFTVRYNANGGTGSMADTKVYYGVSTNLSANTFTCLGYDFDCWFIKRSSDGKWRYQNADNTESGWYTEGQQPEGWSKYRYDDGISVAYTVSNAGEVVDFYAQWK